jgi:hypothetical protein
VEEDLPRRPSRMWQEISNPAPSIFFLVLQVPHLASRCNTHVPLDHYAINSDSKELLGGGVLQDLGLHASCSRHLQ